MIQTVTVVLDGLKRDGSMTSKLPVLSHRPQFFKRAFLRNRRRHGEVSLKQGPGHPNQRYLTAFYNKSIISAHSRNNN